MKLYRFILIAVFAFTTQFAFSQNFVTTDQALELIEVKQAELAINFKNGTLSKVTNDIYSYFFEITLIYLKDGSDIPETLAISFEKGLNRFENYQEDVVTVRDDISSLLTIN